MSAADAAGVLLVVGAISLLALLAFGIQHARSEWKPEQPEEEEAEAA